MRYVYCTCVLSLPRNLAILPKLIQDYKESNIDKPSNLISMQIANLPLDLCFQIGEKELKSRSIIIKIFYSSSY